ncbi:hypothetical protein ANCDUO_07468 [Ancylostoma duodenale]|uniref:Uncharacterized protein n=1 Tax=Ancylostoma duodenale TaxID=51022 RepID=A0A0C2GLY7_9BILA|nr:hypothetical protein ANCDUO_07468 [Ancylostoma duodenale]
MLRIAMAVLTNTRDRKVAWFSPGGCSWPSPTASTPSAKPPPPWTSSTPSNAKDALCTISEDTFLLREHSNF